MSEVIAIDLRGKYLRALLRQEVAYFERNNVESMPSDIGQYFNTVSLGIGENFSQLLASTGTLVGGLAIGFYRGPIFTCACIGYIPFLIAVVVIFGGLGKKAQF